PVVTGHQIGSAVTVEVRGGERYRRSAREIGSRGGEISAAVAVEQGNRRATRNGDRRIPVTVAIEVSQHQRAGSFDRHHRLGRQVTRPVVKEGHQPGGGDHARVNDTIVVHVSARECRRTVAYRDFIPKI